MGEAYPNEASCQLMKHSIAVFQLKLDGGDRYVAPVIANRCRASSQPFIYRNGEDLQTKKIPLATFVSSSHIELVRYDLHHQISPLSLLT